MDPIALYDLAVAEFDRRVTAIGDVQWSAPTPCSEWDVRLLVNHVVANNAIIPEAVIKADLATPGPRPDSADRLGGDPVAAWRRATAAARRAVSAPGVLARPALFPYGDIGMVPVAFLLRMLTTDVAIHAWDLARAIGADETLDDELVGTLQPMVEMALPGMQRTGVFAPPVHPPPGAGTQTHLLAMLGRAA